jgi:hypothetical protein
MYEVMFEGYSVRPFFDLEYLRAHNAERAESADIELINSIITITNASLATHAHTTIDTAKAVVLDSSNAVKFSVHVILPLQIGAALCSLADAKHLAATVVAQLPPELLLAQAADGRTCRIVDLGVYHKNQQLRIMHCVKLGDNRVLRPHPCMPESSPALVDTLICVPRPPTSALRVTFAAMHASVHDMAPAPRPRQLLQQASQGVDAAWPSLAAHLRSLLQCTLYNVQQHATTPDVPSLFISTNSSHAPHALHSSNHAVIEVGCDRMQWRLLCRHGCAAGPWHLLPVNCLEPGVHAPEWWLGHLDRHIAST